MRNQNNAFLAERKKHESAIQRRYGVDAGLYLAVSELVAPYVTPIVKRKGEYLQHAGEIARYLYWITGGVARNGFTTSGGTEITSSFSSEGYTAPPYHDLLGASSGLPARYFVVAETALEGFRLEWDKLTAMLETERAIRVYHTKVLEYLLTQEARRGYTHMAASAADRLAAFRADFPGLENRISQKVVASYLEITPQYLSQLLHGSTGKT